jgi:transposase-like protein
MKTLNPAVARVLKRLHYALDVILSCVRWYVAYPLSLRHLEEMMAERGVSVDHSTVHRWAIKLLPVLEKAFRRRKQSVGKSWRMDESVSRTRAKACGAVLKMGVGLPKPACRSRLQTARCCCVQKAWWCCAMNVFAFFETRCCT